MEEDYSEAMSSSQFNLFLLNKFGTLAVSQEQKDAILNDFFIAYPNWLDKYPNKKNELTGEKSEEETKLNDNENSHSDTVISRDDMNDKAKYEEFINNLETKYGDIEISEAEINDIQTARNEGKDLTPEQESKYGAYALAVHSDNFERMHGERTTEIETPEIDNNNQGGDDDGEAGEQPTEENSNEDNVNDEEIKTFLAVNNIPMADYEKAGDDTKNWVKEEIEKEKNADLVEYLESQNISPRDYYVADKEAKETINKQMKEQQNAELQEFLAKNGISMEEYNSADGNIKSWAAQEMKKEKQLSGFLKKNGISADEYNSADDKTKQWVGQELQKEREEKAAKFKATMEKMQSEIAPNDGEEITPSDNNENEIAPSDNEQGNTGKAEDDPRKETDAYKKPGLTKSKKAEEPKGPFQEGDIIDYMYKEWMIAFMNWCWSKAGKKLNEWGNTAYNSYIAGLQEGRAQKREEKSKNKVNKTLDRHLEGQERTKLVLDKTNEIFQYSAGAVGNIFERLKEGKFDELDLSSLPPEKRESLLANLKMLKEGKLDENSLKGLPEEKRKQLLDDIKKSGKSPFDHFCDHSKEAFGNIQENFKIVSMIAANYTTAAIGDQMSRDKDFLEKCTDPEKKTDIETTLMKQTMTKIFARLDYITELGGDPSVHLEDLANASQKAVKTTNGRIKDNNTVEKGSKPPANKGLNEFRELIAQTEEEQQRPKGKVSMYEELYQGFVTKEGQAKIVATLTTNLMGVQAKEVDHQANVDRLNDTKNNINGNETPTQQQNNTNTNTNTNNINPRRTNESR